MVHTYKSLFEQEKNRLGGQGGGKKKKGGSSRVSLTFVEPEGLFTKEDVFGDFFQCSWRVYLSVSAWLAMTGCRRQAGYCLSSK